MSEFYYCTTENDFAENNTFNVIVVYCTCPKVQVIPLEFKRRRQSFEGKGRAPSLWSCRQDSGTCGWMAAVPLLVK